MSSKKITIFLALLVLAIFAVGSVSATDDIATDSDVPADDITVDDVSADETDEMGKVVEPTRALHNVNNSMSNSDINQEIVAAYNDNTNHVVDFTYGTYYGASFTVQDNVVLDGHDSTLIGDGTNDIFLVTNCKNFTIKNFNINVNGASHGIYGHHVYNSTITNNTIYNCEDAINIYQVYINLTITDNTIFNSSYDGISLVNFNTYSDSEFANLAGSVVTGNNITGGTYGMFFGGNFKGDISDNIITGSKYGMEFKGKKAATNGKLNATFNNNNITDVEYGINMYNPNVVFLNMTNCNISLVPAYVNSSTHWAIGTNANFGATGYIGVYDCNITGKVHTAFKNAVGTNNNMGW